MYEFYILVKTEDSLVVLAFFFLTSVEINSNFHFQRYDIIDICFCVHGLIHNLHISPTKILFKYLIYLYCYTHFSDTCCNLHG